MIQVIYGGRWSMVLYKLVPMSLQGSIWNYCHYITPSSRDSKAIVHQPITAHYIFSSTSQLCCVHSSWSHSNHPASNQAATPFSYCPSTTFLPVWPHCVNARQNRCQDVNSWRTGGDHQDAFVSCGWRLFGKTWNPITSLWIQKLTWLRIVHSREWCLR